MPRITARVGQATFDLLRKKGIQVGVVLDWLASQDDADIENFIKTEGWATPRKAGRRKMPTKALVKTLPKRL